MGKIIGYLKDRSGHKYKIEFVHGGLIFADTYKVLDSSSRMVLERKSKQAAIRALEEKVGPVWND